MQLSDVVKTWLDENFRELNFTYMEYSTYGRINVTANYLGLAMFIVCNSESKIYGYTYALDALDPELFDKLRQDVLKRIDNINEYIRKFEIN